jgi:hypothetical protein
MPHLELTEEEHAALLRLVKQSLDTDHYPLSPRLGPLKAILGRLEPPAPQEPLPPPLRPGSCADPRAGKTETMTETFQASFFPEAPLLPPAMIRQLRNAYDRAERRARENGLPFKLPEDYAIELYRRQNGHCATTVLKINCQHAYPCVVK